MFDLGKGPLTEPLQENIMRLAFSALAVASLALAADPASALERNGTTTLAFGGQKIVQSFKMSFDPASGALRRSGTIMLPSGRMASYAITGTCHKETRSCDLSGSGVGPLGNTWTGTGFAKRDGTRTSLTATVIGPGGRTINVTREVDGDSILPSDL